MATHQVQISAFVSESTRTLLDAAAQAGGLKKGHVIEEALLHHLQALRELPADVIVPARLVLDPASGQEVLDALAHPRAPMPAMLALMAGEDGADVPT